MSPRLGIALSARRLRAVLIRRRDVVWKASVEMDGVDSFAAALDALFASAPPRVHRAHTGVCVGPTWANVKLLHGFPPLESARQSTQLLRENHHAFFLSAGPVAIADVRISAEGARWGAAFDRGAVEELARCLRAHRVRVSRIVPTVVALAAAHSGRAVEWADDGVVHTINGDNVCLRHLGRVPAGPSEQDDPERYADAEAAAHLPRHVPLAWYPAPDPARRRAFAIARNLSASLALGAAVGLLAFGPGLRARAATRANETELARMRSAQKELARGDAELRRVTQMLDRVRSFRAGRGAMSQLLAGVSRLSPDSTAILTFHADSAEGTFTAIAPRVSDVLPGLEHTPGIEAPRIAGSVTREVIGGVRIERAAFRFRRPGKSPPVRSR